MPFVNRRKVFLGAIQTGESIPTLGVGDGGILIKEAASTALELVNNDRSDVARDTLSNVSNVMGSKAATITVEGELIASGSVSTEPTIDPILQCSGLGKSTVTALPIGAITTGPFMRGDIVTGASSSAVGRVAKTAYTGDAKLLVVVTSGTFEAELVESDSSSVTTSGAGAAAGFEYKPISSGHKWGAFSLWEDDYQKTIHSAMGTVVFNFESSLVASFSATLKGPITFDETTPQWGDGTIPTPTFSDELPAVMMDAQLRVSNADGSSLVSSLVGQTVSLDQANDVALRRDMNSASGLKGAHISKRTPTATIGVEYLTDAQYPVYQKLFTNADTELSFRLGDGTAGHTIEIYGRANYNNITAGDENGLSTQSIECSLVDNGAGDGEYSILFL